MTNPRCPKCESKLNPAIADIPANRSSLWFCPSCANYFYPEDMIKEPEDIAMSELHEFIRDKADTELEHRTARQNLDIIAGTLKGLKNAIAALQKIHGPLYR